MTKIFALLLVFVMLATPVFADTVDVSSLSNEELTNLYNSTLAELNKRSLEISGQMYPGTYVVGEDILPGKYAVVFNQEDDSSVYWVGITVYANADKFSENDGEYNELLDDQSLFLDLKDGMVLTLKKGYVSIKSVPTPFWAVK